jgi:hypothetical protein
VEKRVLVAYASRRGSTKGSAEEVCARTFGGWLDIEHAIGPVGRRMGKDGLLSGDFRDWKLIRGWVQDVANELTTERSPRREQ